MAANEDFLLDKRIIKRNITKGLISREDYEKHIANLPDGESNAEVITLTADDEGDADAAPEAAEAAAEAAPETTETADAAADAPVATPITAPATPAEG